MEVQGKVTNTKIYPQVYPTQARLLTKRGRASPQPALTSSATNQPCGQTTQHQRSS
ncbi:hypothetical protein P691DRAFT_810285 [Macrolepiota fuliginosa MF-IS2]|uniref:Uncharacterized protein n=1 Tax=Macrolepiota fuliginosa MF-IS2 TaxID=1400762 RepID=A0A9P5XJS2_9AGAR|nr:hypothetical protein P691DRAFT_810285 [Macrolepiota fuliginosa MF-IS2]